MLKKFWPLLVIIGAIYPLWSWILSRYLDQSDESYGWIALLLFALLFKRQRDFELQAVDAFLIALLMLVYGRLNGNIPMLGSAIIGFSALAIIASRRLDDRPFNLSIWGILMLSLPVAATMQFYIGFPMRLLSSNIAGVILNLTPLEVVVEGGMIRFGEQVVAVDAPCSGIKMLYVTALLVVAICSYKQTNFLKTVTLSVGAFIVLLLVNGMRAAGLFLTESGLFAFRYKEIIHDISGIVIFLLILFSLLGLLKLLDRFKIFDLSLRSLPKGGRTLRVISKTLLLLTAIYAFSTHFLISAEIQPTIDIDPPTSWQGKKLTILPLGEREEQFSRGFPGKIVKATDGKLSYLFRYVNEKSRKLHSAVDCYRGLGYSIEYSPILIDDVAEWAIFYARKGETTLLVKETIIADSGKSWSDVSKWYWSAPIAKLWTNVVIVEQITQ